MDNNNYSNLIDCLNVEIIGNGKKFTYGKVFRRYLKNPNIRYIFWWRLASFLFQKNSKRSIKTSEFINRRITMKYGTEIELGAKIAPGITFAHHQGVVISRRCIIGRNFHIRQNTTIGVKTGVNSKIIIGDNVEIGANTCIIGDDLSIGDNVVIGAMAFVNKNVPSNCVCHSTHNLHLDIREVSLKVDQDAQHPNTH